MLLWVGIVTPVQNFVVEKTLVNCPFGRQIWTWGTTLKLILCIYVVRTGGGWN
jgi:hypothetical protein